VATTSDTVAPKADSKAPVIIDLGKHRRKRIRQLKKGSGRLADEVTSCVEELKAAGTLGANAQTVVIVVRQKRGRSKGLTGLLPGL
jgi:Family of unknown function (DUF6200)